MSDPERGDESAEDVAVRELLANAVALHRAGQLEGARTIYRQVLDANPNHPDALHFLGILAHQIGLDEQAKELIGRAIALAPDYVDAHLNLGNVFLRGGDLDAASACYHMVIALRPDCAEAFNNIGVILHAQGHNEDAVATFRRAIALDGRHADAHFNLGNVLRRQGQVDAAIDCYLVAMTLKPYSAGLYRTLGLNLYAVGRTAEAAAVYRRWLDLAPGSATPQHMLAACSGEHVPPRASDEFVREAFDGFADSFDVKLAQLHYRAPELVFDALVSILGPAARRHRILDAGCGTGLCGALLRPYARRLAGVDLSLGMLQKAHTRALYDELTHAELTAYMRRRPNAFDVIVAADTLVYFGALAPVLSAAVRALVRGGALVFTVEECRDADAPADGVRLRPHGRYTHTEAHVRAALATAGLSARAIERATLRSELDQAVAGLVVTAVNPA